MDRESEEKVIEMYLNRNEEAIIETQNKFGKLCYSISFNILNSSEDVAECLNDTYNALWNAIPPQVPKNLTAFICKIVRNISLTKLDYLTRQKRSSDNILSIDEIIEILPDESFAKGVESEEIAKLISEFLRGEKEDIRNVFIRKYFFFDSISDISSRYSFTQSKVKNMLYHTRTKLHKFLSERGIVI